MRSMATNKQSPRRKSMRLSGYDYTQSGAYFVTICTHKSELIFGAIQDGEMALNEWGHIVKQCGKAIQDHLTSIRLDECVIIPNPVHGIVWIEGILGAVKATHTPPQPPQPFGV